MPFCIGWVENFDEITLSCTVKKIEKENFLKIAKSTFLRYPMGRKFHRNNSILHG